MGFAKPSLKARALRLLAQREHSRSELQAKLAPGSHMLASRATDEAGNVQPETRLSNQSGYNNASWADHAVTVSVA